MNTVSTIASLLLLVAVGCATTGKRQPTENATAKRVVTMQAQPRSFEMDLQKTAVLVVDMQNDFGSKGGLLDRLGISIGEIRAVIPPTARTLAAARSAGIPIVYLKMAYRPDLSDLGASDAPNRIGHLQIDDQYPGAARSRQSPRRRWNHRSNLRNADSKAIQQAAL